MQHITELWDRTLVLYFIFMKQDAAIFIMWHIATNPHAIKLPLKSYVIEGMNNIKQH